MNIADPTLTESEIKATLNAAKTFGGGIVTKIRTAGEISAARRAAAKEVLRAIASNPQGGYYGEYVLDVPVIHDAVLPAHGGEPGIPLIVPFDGAEARTATPADADEIDSYRLSPELYSGAVDGVAVPHDQADANGKMSPVACLYNITSNRLKFTGKSAEVPLFPEITDNLADTKVPQDLAPTVHKRAMPLLVKEGDNLGVIAGPMGMDGKQDLVEISGGVMKVAAVRAVANIIAEQKQT